MCNASAVQTGVSVASFVVNTAGAVQQFRSDQQQAQSAIEQAREVKKKEAALAVETTKQFTEGLKRANRAAAELRSSSAAEGLGARRELLIARAEAQAAAAEGGIAAGSVSVEDLLQDFEFQAGQASLARAINLDRGILKLRDEERDLTFRARSRIISGTTGDIRISTPNPASAGLQIVGAGLTTAAQLAQISAAGKTNTEPVKG